MKEKVRILSFYENWRDLKRMCTHEEWYELEDIILQLRFDGIDTDPKTITNLKIQMAWNLIRPSILKSNRNSRYQDKKNSIEKEAEIAPNKPQNEADEVDAPQEEENLPEAPKQSEFCNSIKEFETSTNNSTITDTNKDTEDMGNYIGQLTNFKYAISECRTQPDKIDICKIIERIKENNPITYGKLKATPSKSLTVNDNMTRMREVFDKDFRLLDENIKNSIYIYIIEEKINN